MSHKKTQKKENNLLKSAFIAVGLALASTIMVVPMAVCENAPSKVPQASYESFVQNTGEEIRRVFANQKETIQNRKSTFAKILDEHFSLESIGKFVLGRYWRRATDQEKTAFLKVFKTALVENYALHFDDYNNETLKVTGSRQRSDGGVIVKSLLQRSGGEPLNVDWTVFYVSPKGSSQGYMRIFDIIVNGASMSISLRAEYNGLLNAKGGTVQGLVDHLNQKYGS